MDTATRQVLEELGKTLREYWNIRPETAGLMHFLARTIRAKDVLELGTSNGYSTIWLADAVRPEKGKVITVDVNQRLLEIARQNFKRAKVSSYIETVLNTAMEAVTELEGPFDFVFLDATKTEYADYLEVVLPKVRVGGIITADNVGGMFAAETEDFREALLKNDQLESTILPIINSETEPDALAIARRVR